MSREKPRNKSRVWKRRRLLAHRRLCQACWFARIGIAVCGWLWILWQPIRWFSSSSWSQIGYVAIVIMIVIPTLLIIGFFVGRLEQLKWPIVFQLALLMAILLAAAVAFVLGLTIFEVVFLDLF